MLHLADWFSGHLSSQEDTDLQCLHSSHRSWAQGQIYSNFSKGAVIIAGSIVEARITSPEPTLDPRSLFKGKVLIRITRARARGQ
jgi:hypothetical protein